MSANCPKCGTYGNRCGNHYVCPICNTSWETGAAAQGRISSELRDQMRDNARSWNEQKERTNKSFNDLDRETAAARRTTSSSANTGKKKKSILTRIVIGVVFAVIAGFIFKSEVGLIIGFIIGFII